MNTSFIPLSLEQRLHGGGPAMRHGCGKASSYILNSKSRKACIRDNFQVISLIREEKYIRYDYC